MKSIVKRVERVNRSGTSKAGNPYHINQTNVVVDIPFESEDGFGSKEMVYQYGDSSNFTKLLPLAGKLPAEVELELGTELDNYDNPKTVIKSVKLPNQTSNTINK